MAGTQVGLRYGEEVGIAGRTAQIASPLVFVSGTYAYQLGRFVEARQCAFDIDDGRCHASGGKLP